MPSFTTGGSQPPPAFHSGRISVLRIISANAGFYCSSHRLPKRIAVRVLIGYLNNHIFLCIIKCRIVKIRVQPSSEAAVLPGDIDAVRIIPYAVQTIFRQEKRPPLLMIQHYPFYRFRIVTNIIILFIASKSNSFSNRTIGNSIYSVSCFPRPHPASMGAIIPIIITVDNPLKAFILLFTPVAIPCMINSQYIPFLSYLCYFKIPY